MRRHLICGIRRAVWGDKIRTINEKVLLIAQSDGLRENAETATL